MPACRRQGSKLIKDMNFNEDDKNDYFDQEYIPEEPKPVKEEKRPVLKPEDPAYWDEPESEFDHLKQTSRSWKLWVWVAVAGVVMGLVIAGWLIYFNPYVENAVTYGYVESIEKRGTAIKTYEGVLLPYKNIMDTTRVYDRDFVFSTVNDTAAVMLRRMQYRNRPVRVEYEVYHAAVPWRGDTKYIVVRVDSVDPRTILPPERQPDL